MTELSEAQANDIKRRHRDRLLRIAGVCGVGVQCDPSGSQRLVVMTDPAADLSALPSEIEGLPVAIERTGPFRAYERADTRP